LQGRRIVKNVYRVFAYLIAALVFVQAAAVAYGFFGLTHWVDEGGVVDKAFVESESSSFTGAAGLMIHGIFGTLVIPVVALLFLIVSFFSKVPGGIKWALIVFVTVVVQVALGLGAHSVPILGLFHGLVALALLGLAITAGQRVRGSAPRHGEPAEPVSAPVA
jgi:heme A synthase